MKIYYLVLLGLLFQSSMAFMKTFSIPSPHLHHRKLSTILSLNDKAAGDASIIAPSSCSGDPPQEGGTSSCDSCPPQSLPSTFEVLLPGPPLFSELRDENIVKIVSLEATDQECNYLCWKCLGYRYNEKEEKFESSSEIFPKWLLKYPTPPDVIGLTRKYDPETDRSVRNASMDLMRSIPRDFKGGVRSLQSVGFKGFKLSELTPNKTRRAQLCNWLIYYRERLFGKTIEQLRAERQKEKEAAQEIAELPSEKMFQKLRLD